jgi:hypothetical protein
MRIIFVAALSGCVSLSLASFDLILVSDLSKNCIHRYDGDSGAYLGSFGQNFLNSPRGLALDQANQRVIVESLSGISTFNYNTGQHISTNPVFSNARDIAFLGTNYYRGFSAMSSSAMGRVVNYQTSTFQTLYNAGSIGTWTGVTASSGTLKPYSLDLNTGRVGRWNVSVTGGLEAVTANTVIRSGLGANGTYVIGLGDDGAMVSVNASTMAVTTGLAPSGAAWTDGIDAAFGHGTTAWALGTAAGETILQSYAQNPSTLLFQGLNRFSASQVTSPQSMVVVVAPEPMSMSALALGTLALLKRRKKS